MIRQKFNFLLLLLLLSCNKLISQDWKIYPYNPPGSVLNFPKDDGRHHGIKNITEWHYINLHLIGSAPEYRKYDVMLAYFRKPVTMRIFNVSEPKAGIFHVDVDHAQNVYSQKSDSWDLRYKPRTLNDYSYATYPFDGVPYSYVFHTTSIKNNDVIDLKVTSLKPPLVVGGDGYIPIGVYGDSSFYYSYTNMKVEGNIIFNGIKDSITSGIGWIDRQYGPFIVGVNPNAQYEWFSLQLDNPNTMWGTPQNPTEINIWQVFNKNRIPYNASSRLASSIYANNNQDTSSNFIFERTGYWFDSIERKYYSQGWRYIDPLKEVTVDMTPDFGNQIIDVTLFKFWEGSTLLKGVIGDEKVDGLGFAELVTNSYKKIICPSPPTNLVGINHVNYNELNWNTSNAGTFPIGGYRIYRSTQNDGHWKYLGSTTNLSYQDYPDHPNQTYYYTITSFDNWSSTSASKYADAIMVAPSNGKMAQKNDLNNIEIYPNPSREKVFIKIGKMGQTKVELFHSDGRKIFEKLLDKELNEMNIAHLACGIYFIHLSTDEEMEVKKLIIE